MTPLHKVTGATAFFVAVFLNAFVDLGHKIVVQNTVYKLYDGSAQVILTALVNGLILLPFILLLSPAGFLSDRFAKTGVMRFCAWGAVLLTSLITVFYYLGWFQAAFAMTFLLAAQSTVYSPAKFGYIKFLFGKERLGEGNGVVSALSIIAILAGIFGFSVLFELGYALADRTTTEAEILKAIAPVGLVLVLCSLVQLWLTYTLPADHAAASSRSFSLGAFASGQLFKQDLVPLVQSRAIRLAVMGLAVFWAVGQVMLAAFPAFFKEISASGNTILVQGILACTGVGIALGSMVAGRYSRNYIETGLLPLGAIGIAVGLLVLPGLGSAKAFALDFLFIGFCGGLFVVPLNALIQYNAREPELGRTLAANNWVQNVAMLAFLILTACFAYYGWTSKTLLQIIAVVALIGCCYVVYQLPQSLTRFVLSFILSRRYRVDVQGMKNIPPEGGVLMLGNHISWIDWAIVQIASPRPIRFVMTRSIYQKWYLKWFFDLFGTIPIDTGPRSRRALQQVAECLNQGEVVCLFPEGSISRSGHLGEFRRGYERACAAVGDEVLILPFYLRGLWGSQFSRSSSRMKAATRSVLRRDVIIAFGPPLPRTTPADLLKRRVFDLSIRSWQVYAEDLPTADQLWVRSARRNAGRTVIVDAVMGQELSGGQALAASAMLARRVRSQTHAANIGVLLPTSAAGALINMAVLMAGKTVVNLNYTAGLQALQSAVLEGRIDTVYTSHRFLQRLQRRGVCLDQLFEQVNRQDMEAVTQSLGRFERLLTFVLARWLPGAWLAKLWCAGTDGQATAAILFSSGSEGAPKGVQLSHRNIVANVKQIADVLNMEDDDAVMANLPLFHAFGLTVNQFLPLLEGCPMICHADPTDALGCAKAITRYRATIMCGTSTFLRLYCRNPKVHPLMLESLRIVVTGAEKLSEEVSHAFQQKFNKTLLEGYGATETTPVVSVNLPDKLEPQTFQVQRGHKLGSVGMPLPGTSCAIVDPDTLAELPTGEAGMILIGGVQVMQGYLNNAGKTDQVIKTINGARWYVTGDKGYIDADGFLFIVDRYSRFAKIAGEMISLAAVEAAIARLLDKPECEAVVTALADPQKGEKLVVLCDFAVDEEALQRGLQQQGLPPLAIPSIWLQLDLLPKLGSGKTDYAGARTLAAERLGS